MKKIWRKLENSLLLQIVIFLMLMVPLIIGYRAVKVQLDRRYEVVNDDFTWVYQIDGIDRNKNKLVVNGFAFKLKKNSESVDFEIILRDVKTEEKIYPRMSFYERKDVERYFKCEYDYSQSGFMASISDEELNLEENTYEILLHQKGERVAYKTSVYISNGNISYINPDMFSPLSVEGTDLEEIVESGILRVYRPDVGMYVYQYNGELYWIADEKYAYAEDYMFMDVHLNTTQIDRLPAKRLENHWYWDNISFVFKNIQLDDWDTGAYRVAKCSIPTEYAISQMWAGYYEEMEWVWKCDFRPYYQFIEE